jgi:hypothetical protein
MALKVWCRACLTVTPWLLSAYSVLSAFSGGYLGCHSNRVLFAQWNLVAERGLSGCGSHEHCRPSQGVTVPPCPVMLPPHLLLSYIWLKWFCWSWIACRPSSPPPRVCLALDSNCETLFWTWSSLSWLLHISCITLDKWLHFLRSQLFFF